MKTARRGRAIAVAIAAALALSACSGGGDEPDSAAGERQAGGGPFVMALPAIPESIDPQTYQAQASNDTYPAWSSTLIRYAEVPAGRSGLQGPDDIVGELAESWEVEEDGDIRFTLKDARSPYGNTVTSEDVKWSFERMKELDSIVGFLFSVGSFDTNELITVVDDKTFVLNTTGPNILTLRTLIWYSTGIIDSTEARKHATPEDPWAKEWLSKNSATFGPYQVSRFEPGQSIELKPNPNYHGDAPEFDSVVMRGVPESSTRLQLVSSGDVDSAGSLALDHFAALRGNSDVNAIEAPTANVDILYLNSAFEPFADPRVRRAIAMSIDRKSLIDGAYQGFGRPADQQFDSDINPLDTYPVPPIPYDPEGAKALLAEAGYPDGFAFTLIAHPGRPGPQAEPMAVLIRDQLAKIGIDVTIQVVASPAEFGEGRSKSGGNAPRYQAWFDIGSPIIPDSIYYAALYFGSKGSNNLMGYHNPRIDELITQALTLPQGPERDAVLTEIMTVIDADTPLVPLVETINPVALRSDITGYFPVADNRIYPDVLGRDE